MAADLQERPTSAPSASTDAPLATRLAAVSTRRRRLEEQLESLRSFDRRLSDEVRDARTAHAAGDRVVRELLARRLGVRARISDAADALTRATDDEEQLRLAA